MGDLSTEVIRRRSSKRHANDSLNCQARASKQSTGKYLYVCVYERQRKKHCSRLMIQFRRTRYKARENLNIHNIHLPAVLHMRCQDCIKSRV